MICSAFAKSLPASRNVPTQIGRDGLSGPKSLSRSHASIASLCAHNKYSIAFTSCPIVLSGLTMAAFWLGPPGIFTVPSQALSLCLDSHPFVVSALLSSHRRC